MEITAIVPWLSAAALLISIITAVNTFVNAGAKANSAKLANHEARLTTLEGEVKHLPNRNQAHRLELAVEKLSGRIDVLAGDDRWWRNGIHEHDAKAGGSGIGSPSHSVSRVAASRSVQPWRQPCQA